MNNIEKAIKDMKEVRVFLKIFRDGTAGAKIRATKLADGFYKKGDNIPEGLEIGDPRIGTDDNGVPLPGTYYSEYNKIPDSDDKLVEKRKWDSDENPKHIWFPDARLVGTRKGVKAFLERSGITDDTVEKILKAKKNVSIENFGDLYSNENLEWLLEELEQLSIKNGVAIEPLLTVPQLLLLGHPGVLKFQRPSSKKGNGVRGTVISVSNPEGATQRTMSIYAHFVKRYRSNVRLEEKGKNPMFYEVTYDYIKKTLDSDEPIEAPPLRSGDIQGEEDRFPVPVLFYVKGTKNSEGGDKELPLIVDSKITAFTFLTNPYYGIFPYLKERDHAKLKKKIKTYQGEEEEEEVKKPRKPARVSKTNKR